jgi:RNA polymerase sigma factor (sigma-70 family)
MVEDSPDQGNDMMTNHQSDISLHVHRPVPADGAGMTDGQLLECFVSDREESALEALVRRHGPMVWGVCCRLLANRQDAEDAFQATFLVLVRKASAISSPELLGNWLYGVAYQTARKARQMAAKRRTRERQVTQMPEPEAPPQDLLPDLQPILDEELSRLPDRYRAVLVLCDLEGKSRKEVAGQLGLPEGTVASRLARARALLASRLTQRGLTLSAGLLAVLLSRGRAAASVPTSLVSATTRAGSLLASGGMAGGAISGPVVVLTEGVMKAMFVSKWKIATVVILAGVLLAFLFCWLMAAREATMAARAAEFEHRHATLGSTAEVSEVQVRIVGPPGMTVSLLTPAGPGSKLAPVPVPARFHLEPGKHYRLKLADIPQRPGVERFPTLQIPLVDAGAEPFVNTNAIVVEFTEDDFDQIDEGKRITKAFYLSPQQGLGAGRIRPAQTVPLASYDYPGRNMLEEARQRGPVLAVVRMGTIDLGAARETREKGKAGNRDEHLEYLLRKLVEKTEALRAAEKEIKSLREALEQKKPGGGR